MEPIRVEQLRSHTEIVELNDEEARLVVREYLTRKIRGIKGADSWWIDECGFVNRMDDYGHHRDGEIDSQMHIASEEEKIIAMTLVHLGIYSEESVFRKAKK